MRAALVFAGGCPFAWPLTLGVFANELRRRALERQASRVKPSEDDGATALGILLLALVAIWAPFALFSTESRVPLGTVPNDSRTFALSVDASAPIAGACTLAHFW